MKQYQAIRIIKDYNKRFYFKNAVNYKKLSNNLNNRLQISK